MDSRWAAPTSDSASDFEVFLHPTASMDDVRNGKATDGVDLSPYVSRGTQGFAESEVTLVWNNELDGDNQPRPGQVLEIQSDGQVLWIGVVDTITGYTLAHGTREMTVTARTRDSLDIWRVSQRVTQLYPQMTNLQSIAQDVCAAVGLLPDEIQIPVSSIVTAHSNTQMAGITAWEMLSTLFMAMGFTPFVDWGGRVRGAPRQVSNRTSDIEVPNNLLNKVNASRNKPPTTRIILEWLDPNLSKAVQQGRKLADATITCGFFVPFVEKDIWFSSDQSQRAENTYLRVRQSANALWIPVCLELWDQTAETAGNIKIVSLGWSQALFAMALAIQVASAVPDGVVVSTAGIGVGGGTGFTIPTGRKWQAAAEVALYLTMMSVGTGVYEVWGNPYDWVHARNTSEAYDVNAPAWMDNPQTISNDFIVNEAHAQATCVRELQYLSDAANRWSVTIVDDKRVEYGDVLGFDDGSQMYVTDFKRSITRGTTALLDVSGFLL